MRPFRGSFFLNSEIVLMAGSTESTIVKLNLHTAQTATCANCKLSQRLITFLPIAGAQFIRLQRIQHTEHFIHITAHAEVIDT